MNEENKKMVEEGIVELQENSQAIVEDMNVQQLDENNSTKETKEELQNDGLKFVGIVFVILFIFLILLPYISQMF